MLVPRLPQPPSSIQESRAKAGRECANGLKTNMGGWAEVNRRRSIGSNLDREEHEAGVHIVLCELVLCPEVSINVWK
jgi:hypothetical protein